MMSADHKLILIYNYLINNSSNNNRGNTQCNIFKMRANIDCLDQMIYSQLYTHKTHNICQGISTDNDELQLQRTTVGWFRP